MTIAANDLMCGTVVMAEPICCPTTTAATVVTTVTAVEVTAVTTVPTEAALGTIIDLGAENADFSTLVAALTTAGLVDTLAGDGPYTVFAPTNDAFAALPAGTVDFLLLPENLAELQAVLTYHVVSGSYLSSDLVSGDVVTINGAPVTVTVSDAGIMVNDANVVMADILASNGVIHVIDKVLIPPVEPEPVTTTPPPPTPPPVTVEPVEIAGSISMPTPDMSGALFSAKSGKGSKSKAEKKTTKTAKALPVKDAKAEKVKSAKSTKMAKVSHSMRRG